MANIGKLTEVDVRELWKHEQYDFSNWLAKEEIEAELGFKLIWDRLDGKKASRIKYRIQGLNFDDHSNYNELMNQTIEAAVKMRDVFKKYI